MILFDNKKKTFFEDKNEVCQFIEFWKDTYEAYELVGEEGMWWRVQDRDLLWDDFCDRNGAYSF